MAIRALHAVANDWETTFASGLSIGGLSAVIVAPTVPYPATPFKIQGGTERIRVSAIAVDTPSAGQDTLTITRGADGTTAAAHSAGSSVSHYADANDYMEMHRNVSACRALIAAMMGVAVGASTQGVQRTSAGTDLKVAAQGTPGMTVKVQKGAGVVSGEPVAVLADTNSATVVAPVTNPRIDLVEIDQDGEINIVGGAEAGSPSAPSATADCMGLATIYCRVGMTSIKDTDDSSNGYITDTRTFL